MAGLIFTGILAASIGVLLLIGSAFVEKKYRKYLMTGSIILFTYSILVLAGLLAFLQ